MTAKCNFFGFAGRGAQCRNRRGDKETCGTRVHPGRTSPPPRATLSACVPSAHLRGRFTPAGLRSEVLELVQSLALLFATGHDGNGTVLLPQSGQGVSWRDAEGRGRSWSSSRAGDQVPPVTPGVQMGVECHSKGWETERWLRLGCNEETQSWVQWCARDLRWRRGGSWLGGFRRI